MASEPTKTDEFINKDMAEAADRINALWERSEKLKSDWIQSVVDVGQACIEAKAKLNYGEWGRLFENGHMKFSRQMANNYIRVAELINALPDVKHALQLPSDVTSVALLATLEPKQLMDAISKGLVTPQSTRSEVREVIKEIKTPPTQQEIQAAAAERVAEERKKAEETQRELDTALATITGLQNEVNNYKAESNNLQSKVDELEKYKSSVADEIENLKRQKKLAERDNDPAEVRRLTNEIKDWETKAAALQKDLNKKNNELEKANENLTNARSELEKRPYQPYVFKAKGGKEFGRELNDKLRKLSDKLDKIDSELSSLFIYIISNGIRLNQFGGTSSTVSLVTNMSRLNKHIVDILTNPTLEIWKVETDEEVDTRVADQRALPIPINSIFNDEDK